MDREQLAAAMGERVRAQARDIFTGEHEGDDVVRAALDHSRIWAGIPSYQSLRDICLSLREVPGAFVECGVAAGSSLVVMAALAGDRHVWGFDSFEGFPELADADAGSGAQFVGMSCAGEDGIEAVYRTFDACDVPTSKVRLVKGWFVDTIPAVVDEVGPIALLRLDSDFYEATRLTVEQFYPSVVPGGVVIVNDYFAFDGCRKAIDDYRTDKGITNELCVVSPHGEVHWHV